MIRVRGNHLSSISNAASAIIAQFSPGDDRGQALTEALLGKINPPGTLTVSGPASFGQIPISLISSAGRTAKQSGWLLQPDMGICKSYDA
jgi:hypothetical protein